MTKNEVFADVLKQLYEQTNRKHDCHYQEGKGALFVPEGYPLHPRNVVYQIDEMQIRFMTGDIGGFSRTFRF